MNEQEIKKLAKTGLLATAVRQVLVQATGLVTWIVLARWLEPADFGLFSAAGLAVQIFSVFGEMGMGLALIRRAEEPTREEMDVVFTLQLAVMTVICGLAAAALPFLPSLVPQITPTGVKMALVLVLCSWLTAFRIIPSAILTRRMVFTKIAVAELAENVAFNIAAVVAVLAGAGVWSLAIGAVTRSLIGTGMLQYFAPFRARLRWRLKGVRDIVATGWGFQSFYAVSFFKDLTLPAFMIALLGSAQFGYFVWARELVFRFLTFGRLFDKVAMPTLARLSSTGADIVSVVRRSGNLLGLFYWPLAVILIGASSFYIPYIFSGKWLPAQPALIILALSLLLQVWLTPMWSLIQAKSPARWPLRTVAILAVFQVTTGFLAIWSNGIMGAALAMLAVNLLTILLYLLEMTRLFPGRRSFFHPITAKALINTLLAGLTLWLTWRLQGGFRIALGLGCGCALLAFVVNWLLFKEDRGMILQIAGAAAAGLGNRTAVWQDLGAAFFSPGTAKSATEGAEKPGVHDSKEPNGLPAAGPSRAAHVCPLCGGAVHRTVVNFKSGAAVLECRDCGNGHLWPSPGCTAADYGAGIVNAPTTAVEDDLLLRAYARDFCIFVDEQNSLQGKRLLEIGCGTGYFLEEALRRGAKAEGLEIDPNRRQACVQRGLTVHGHDLADWLKSGQAPCDLVVLSHVLEHVPEPAPFLHQCRRLLRPGGSICLAQPLHTGLVPRVMGRRWYAWAPTQHYWHFTPGGLPRVLAAQGFRTDAIRKTHLTYRYPRVTDLGKPKFFAAFLTQAVAGSASRLIASHDLFYLNARAE